MPNNIGDKTKQFFNKSKNFVKDLFSSKPKASNEINIHGIEVKEADGDIQS